MTVSDDYDEVNEYEVTANSAGSNAGTGIVRFSSNVI